MPWPGGAKRKEMPFMFKSTSTSLILLGILAVIVGIIAIAWPSVTVFALLFGLFSLIYGISRITLGVQLHRLHSQRSAQPPSALREAT
jgi:uncharacterized membrane protein HdeD (DUF308 family)